MHRGFLWVYPIWDSVSFLNQQVYVPCQIWGVFSHYFFKYFSVLLSFSFPSRTPMTLSVGSFVIVPKDLQALFIHFSIYFVSVIQTRSFLAFSFSFLFCLNQVFVEACRLPLVLLLQCMGSRARLLSSYVCGLSCPAVCGILVSQQGSDPHHLF